MRKALCIQPHPINGTDIVFSALSHLLHHAGNPIQHLLSHEALSVPIFCIWNPLIREVGSSILLAFQTIKEPQHCNIIMRSLYRHVGPELRIGRSMICLELRLYIRAAILRMQGCFRSRGSGTALVLLSAITLHPLHGCIKDSI